MNTHASQGEQDTSLSELGAPAEGAGTDSGQGGGAVPGGSRVLARPRPTPQPRVELCPYCGHESMNTTRCDACGGKFDALSRQATQNAMGPWWLRDPDRPFRPGCAYETIRALVARGTITRDTVLRGPPTRQFWKLARRAPGVAHLLGVCHACQRDVSPEAFMCPACGASFGVETDRQHLGLAPVSLLPGQASPERIAAVSVPTAAAVGGASGSGSAAGAGPVSLAGSLGGLLDDAGRVLPAPSPAALPRGVRAGDPMNESLAAVRALATVPPDALHEHRSDHPHHHSHHHRQRGPSPVAAIAFFVLGIVLTVSGIGAALITAQGGLEQALAAVGLGPSGGARIADARGASDPDPAGGGVSDAPVDPGAAPPGGANVTPGAEPGPGPGGTAPIAQGRSDAGARAETGSPPGSAADPARRRAEALAPILELLASGRTSDLREALRVLDRDARDQSLGAADLAAWRAALEARLARESLGDLP